MDFKVTNSFSRENLNYEIGTVKNIHYGDIHTKFRTLFDITKEVVPFINEEINIDRISDENYCREGDMIFADASEDLNDVGKSIEIINLNCEKLLSGLHTLLGRPKSSVFHLGFNGYLFKSNSVRTKIQKESQGSKVLSINVGRISNIELSFPSVNEQERITNLLSLLDERVQTQNKIIEQLETLIKGVCQKLANNKPWQKQYLQDILTERKESNKNNLPVFSVSVSKGVINQIEYLGRSFASKNTTNYNVVHFGDVVYTKSPTGEFPYGIIKQSFISENVAVSPLYGVYEPKNVYIGSILHYYFNSSINTNNYLHSLVQKGAKNTINITNQRFLDNTIFLPTDEKEVENIASLLNTIDQKIQTEEAILEQLKMEKKYLLQRMFI
ncbi:MAG: restriction endonuclease subunit S [Bacteroidetes bacterium]|nr:restriction endonuclease subunit S [Bacteroidota bacterium]